MAASRSSFLNICKLLSKIISCLENFKLGIQSAQVGRFSIFRYNDKKGERERERETEDSKERNLDENEMNG